MLEGRSGPKAKADLQSLPDDLEHALRALGPATTAAAYPALGSFLAKLADLPTRLKQQHEAGAMAAEVQDLLDALQQPAVAQAAWDDAVEAYRDEATTAQQGELRILQLRELLEWRQHDWKQVADTLTSIISDSREMAQKYGLEEGELEADSEFAGRTEDARLDHCRWYVGQEPRRVNIAVWFVLTGAALPGGQLELGPVRLFDGRLVSEPLEGGKLPSLGLPEFYDVTDSAMWFTPPPAEHCVLARVWLEGVTKARAGEQARELVETLIEVSNDRSEWLLWEGHAMWREGGTDWFGSTFYDPRIEEGKSRYVHPVFEPTARALAEFAPRFAARLAAGDADAAEAVEDARWVISVDHARTPPQRIALGTRALERSLSLDRKKWSVTAEKYLFPRWFKRELDEMVHHGAVSAYNAVPRMTDGGKTREEVHDLTLPEDEPGTRYPSPRGLAEVFERYPDAMLEGSVQHRIARDASAVLSSPADALAFVEAMKSRFRLLLARLERTRNAITHGTRPVPAVLASVDDCVVTLGHVVAAAGMHRAEHGTAPLELLDDQRAKFDAQESRLKAGEDPVTVWYPNGWD